MDFERLDSLAKKYMIKRKTHMEREIGDVYFHGKRVARSAVLLRERIFPGNADWDGILYCSGMFHDIGKGIEPHGHSGAVLVRDLLKEELTAIELDSVCTIIEAHNDRRPGTEIHTDMEKLIQDADLLDHYGSQGIWMSCNYYAYMGQQEMQQMPVFYFSEWEEQVKKQREYLNFDVSKAIFDEKVRYEWSAVKRMETEGKGEFI